jgi:hypothetical protein
MTYRRCFAAQSDLSPDERELMQGLLAALPTIRYGSTALTAPDGNSSRFKRQTRFIAKLKHKTQRFGPHFCQGEVMARPSRVTNLPEVAAKKTQGGFDGKVKNDRYCDDNAVAVSCESQCSKYLGPQH